MSTPAQDALDLLANDLQKVCETNAGIRILRWIVYGADAGNLEGPVWDTDPLAMALKEGRRDLARKITNKLREIDDLYGMNLSKKLFEARFARAPVEEKDNG